MPFFDFHLHPALKAQFSAPANKPSPWDKIHLTFSHPDIILKLIKCQGIDDVIDSQASLTQLSDAGMSLFAIALHPPEAAMMNDGLIQKIAEEEQTTFIDNDKVDAIGTGNIYFTLLNQELDHIEQHLQLQGRKLKIIKKISEYDPSATNTIHAILNVEGPHAFYGDRKGKSLAQIMTDVKTNFKQFTEVRGVRIFAMNIAHLEKNDFCNHAYGIQIFKPEPFFPKSKGISNEGLELLLMMQQKNILCDIKHTSLFARQQLYLLGWHGNNWPLVCTHAGLTGIPSTARGKYFLSNRKFGNGFLRVKHYKPVGYLSGTSFNPSSINLYDDDVSIIVKSGGLIGLSMDQRILGSPNDEMFGEGYVDEIYEEEVISDGEREWFRDVDRNFIGDEFVLKTEQISTHDDRQNTARYHARHFLNHVFHLFAIARQYGIPDMTMAERICIGSDFDGMINPLDSCTSVTGLKAFKSLLLQNFSVWEDEFEEAKNFRVSDFISPQALLDNIFFKNGEAFLKKWYV